MLNSAGESNSLCSEDAEYAGAVEFLKATAKHGADCGYQSISALILAVCITSGVPDLVSNGHSACTMWWQLLSDGFATQGGLVDLSVFGRSVHSTATLGLWQYD